MKYCLFLFISLMLILPLSTQEKIEEKVSVDWWVLPIFVLDKDGNSVLDLKDTDIDLRVNNLKVTGFSLYKRKFSVEEKIAQKEAVPLLEKRKIVFLLFDVAYSTRENFHRSKEVAKNLVNKADADTLFSVIGIDPFAGPEYAGGPLSDKKKVIELIDTKINWAPNSKSIAAVLRAVYGSQMDGSRVSRLEDSDIAVLTEQRSSGLRKSNTNYFRAFQTLHHALNTIKDNKFIYLFSEGISLFARQSVTHGAEEFWFFIKQTAGYLSRCGAVLFIINPAGETVSSTSITSGEDSLRFLARESGGKYMEGAENFINHRIESMAHSYYEIAFPDHEAFREGIRKITVRSRRRGVDIHTLRNLEKSKQYSEMKDIEKKILVVNLLNPSPLFQSPLKTSHLKIDQSIGKEGDILYKIELPADFKQKSLELYKVRVDEFTHEAKIEKKKFISTERPLEIAMDKKDLAEVRLVLVNEKAGKALVQGIFNAEAEKDSILVNRAEDFKKKVEQMKTGEVSELNRITNGVIAYCGSLSQAAFHFICKETVKEVVDDIRVHKAIREAQADRYTGAYRAGFRAQDDRRVVRRKLTNNYVNDYQLISIKGKVREQRKLIKGKVKKIAGKEDLLRLNAFVSKKVSLIPLSLLAPGSQDRFHFRFIKYDKVKGVKTAVIECFPKNPGKIKSIYGKIWVDLSDYSIVRISVNPVSIGGYSELLKRARYYNSKLILTCDIDFYKKRGGIRFPTKVLIRETYSGGRELRTVVNKPVWERSKTTYTFDDYRFFDVTAAATEEDVEK